MNIVFNRQGKIKFLKKYVIKRENVSFVFPKGFTSDGASIPWFLEMFANPYESDTLESALVHDALYGAKGEYKVGKKIYKVPRYNVDRTFRLLLRSSHVPLWKAWAYWIGVRIGGWYPWIFNPKSKTLISVIVL